MPSPIDICNMALSEVGARGSIASFNEGSKEALQCSIWYDKMRQIILRSAPWGFARAQAVLSPLGDLASGTSAYPWPFKYLYPADCMKARFVLPPTPTNIGSEPLAAWYRPSRANRFIIGNETVTGNQRKVIYTNICQAQLVYTVDVTDVTMFDALFENALSAALAAKIVLPLTGNKDMRMSFIQAAQAAISEARVADGNEAMPSTDHTPDWIAVRGSGFMQTVMPFGDIGFWYSGFDDYSWGA